MPLVFYKFILIALVCLLLHRGPCFSTGAPQREDLHKFTHLKSRNKRLATSRLHKYAMKIRTCAISPKGRIQNLLFLWVALPEITLMSHQWKLPFQALCGSPQPCLEPVGFGWLGTRSRLALVDNEVGIHGRRDARKGNIWLDYGDQNGIMGMVMLM